MIGDPFHIAGNKLVLLDLDLKSDNTNAVCNIQVN